MDDVDFEGFDLDDIEKSKLSNDKKLNAIAKSFEGFELDDIEKSKIDENDEVPHQETQKLDKH